MSEGLRVLRFWGSGFREFGFGLQGLGSRGQGFGLRVESVGLLGCYLQNSTQMTQNE